MPTRRALLGLLAGGCLAAPILPAIVAGAQATGRAAPDFAGIAGWLNTPVPITLAGLRGKVVLVDFWTYSCINCRRTIPYLNRWQAEYGKLGLAVIGIHTPEFRFEHTRPDVAAAVRALGIQFPVGQDNDFRTWQAWGNEAWPAFYLLDRNGRIVLRYYGEGHAQELEATIRAQLGMPLAGAQAGPGDDPNLSRIGSPEFYFGAIHPTPQDRAQDPRLGEARYVFPTAAPRLGDYQLAGTWLRQGEALVLRSAQGGLRMRFSAAKAHLVAAAQQRAALRVRVDGGATRTIQIGRPTLYTVFDSSNYADHLLEIEADAPGVSFYSMTFG